MELLMLLKKILKANAITASQKKSIETSYKSLSKDEKEVLKGDYEKALALDGDDDNGDDDGVKAELKSLLEGVEDKTYNKVLKKVDEFMKEEKEKMAKKIGAYSEKKIDKTRELSAKVKGMMTAILKKDDTLLKEMTTDATGTPYAGYTVDSELSAEIRHLMTEYGVAAREMMSITLSKGDLKANDLMTDVSVNWTDETGSILSSEVVLGQETLALKKLTAIVALTSELMEDTEIDLFSFVAGRVAEGFAKKIDLAFFKGDGTSTYGSFTGILENASVNTVSMTGATFASIDADDLLDMRDATPQGALSNSKYYMHRTIRSYIRKLKATDGTYIYQEPSAGGPATIWGDPVVEVEAMPSKTDTAAETGFVIFGDLKKACIYATKGQMKAKRFDAGIVRNVADGGDINLITSDREAVRWTTRVGYIVILPKAITILKTAESSA